MWEVWEGCDCEVQGTIVGVYRRQSMDLGQGLVVSRLGVDKKSGRLVAAKRLSGKPDGWLTDLSLSLELLGWRAEKRPARRVRPCNQTKRSVN